MSVGWTASGFPAYQGAVRARLQARCGNFGYAGDRRSRGCLSDKLLHAQLRSHYKIFTVPLIFQDGNCCYRGSHVVDSVSALRSLRTAVAIGSQCAGQAAKGPSCRWHGSAARVFEMRRRLGTVLRFGRRSKIREQGNLQHRHSDCGKMA